MHSLRLSALLSLTIACGDKSADTADTPDIEDSPDTGDTGDNQDTADTVDTSDTGDNSDMLNYERHFTRFGGCGDVFVYGHKADDTISLQISGSGLVRAAFEAEQSTTTEFDLTQEVGLTIAVQHGQYLNHESCNDALDPEIQVVVNKTYVPVNGTLSIAIEPTGEETSWGELPSNATISLQASDFCANGSSEDCLNIGELSFTTAVGWLAG